MRVAMGSDHAGFELKETLKASLIEEHYEILDVGTHGTGPVDYPDYAEAVGTTLRESRADRGIIICGSGVGASMAANRVPGVRAGLCHDTYSAHQGVEHDDMNVLVLGGRVVGIELAHELTRAFLNAHFTGEPRHLRRLAKMTSLENPLRALQVFGQSVWLDYIRRSLITSGELRGMIDEDGLRGVTSNPAIFEKAITGSSDYKSFLEAPDARSLDAKALYERLAVRDIQDAADALRPVYEATSTRDGYVSLEVSPSLAYDTAGTLDEARRLWRAVGRDNLMIKIPATPQGVPAVQQLIGEGINVNVTLLFAQEVYEQVAEAYIAGLERLAANGGDLKRVASVASFFISRIDTAIDALISARLQGSEGDGGSKRPARLERQGRHRQCQAHLPAIPGAVQRPALAGAGGPRRANAAAALGEHWHQESQLSRRTLRGRTGRARHRQYHSSRYLRRLSRSRSAARQPRGRCRVRVRHDGGARGSRNLHESRDRHASRRRGSALLGCLREAADRSGHAKPAVGSRKNQPAELLRARAACRRRYTPR